MTAPPPSPQLTLLRHGKSVWNLENRFTGWADVPLAEEGCREARAAAAAMRRAGLRFDAAFSSCLRRAIATLWTALEEMDIMWTPQASDWRLNERHYGALQGQNKAAIAAQYGEAQVKTWRRGFDSLLPPLTESQSPLAGVTPPPGESLKDILPRVRAVFDERIAPLLSARQSVLVVAHGNSLRALIKMLEGVSDDDIMSVEVKTATPWVYQLDENLQPAGKEILAVNS